MQATVTIQFKQSILSLLEESNDVNIISQEHTNVVLHSPLSLQARVPPLLRSQIETLYFHCRGRERGSNK